MKVSNIFKTVVLPVAALSVMLIACSGCGGKKVPLMTLTLNPTGGNHNLACRKLYGND